MAIRILTEDDGSFSTPRLWRYWPNRSYTIIGTQLNIKQIDETKFEIRFSYTDDLTGKRRRVRRRIEGTLTDAIKLRDTLKEAASKGRIGTCEHPDRRLEGWLHVYLDHRQTQVAASTFSIEENVFTAFIVNEVGDWRPDKVDIHHLDSLVRRWVNDNETSTSTTYNRRGMLLRFLRWVCRRIGRDPSFLREVMPVKKTKTHTGRALTPSEAKAFLTAMKNDYPQHHALVFTLLITGQRWGSVTALRWDDIDHEKGLITFSQSHYRGEVKKGNKSGKTVRLPMPDALATVLKGHRKTMMETQHVNLSTGLCFPSQTPASKSPSNGYQNAGDLRYAFKQCCENAGIDRITPHDLRRTCNTWAVESGVSGTVLRSITGHSSSSMTDHYYRGSTTAKKEALGSVLSLVEGS